MPFNIPSDLATPDTSELDAQAPPQSLPAYQDDTGTGANGPKYSTADFWTGVAQNTIYGKLIANARARDAAGYTLFEPNTPIQGDPQEMIPEDMKPFADRYVGLYTKEEMLARTFELRQAQYNAIHGGQSKWAGVANLAAGLTDPIGVASMFLPGGAETRLGAALKLAAIGGGVSAADEAILSQIDPNWDFVNAMKDVGAGALISGVLGGVLGHKVPQADYERLRANLQEDFNAPSPEPQVPQSGDSAQAIAADIRAAAESRSQATAAAGETQGSAGVTAPQAAEINRVAPFQMSEADAQDGLLLHQLPRDLATQWAAAHPDYIGPEGENGLDDRYANVRAALQAGDTLDAPSAHLRITPKGPELEFYDGRHRFAAARDLGYDTIPVALTPESRGVLQELRIRGARADDALHAGGISAAPGVEQRVYDQLVATGHEDNPARQYAALVGDFYATQASRLGMTADHLFERHPFNVKSGEPLTTVVDASQALQQPGRGEYDPSTHTVMLGENANASTFLHEAAHHFLEVMSQLARAPDAPLSIRSDMDMLLDWFRVKDLKAWRDLGLEGQRDSHEKFARGFEQYLRDGVAPSLRLQDVFDQLRDWLSQIYKTAVSEFAPRLPQDIREVMDRMLASSQEAVAATAKRVAEAPTPNLARVAGDAPLRYELRRMAADEAGWAQVGGKMIRREIDGGRGNEFDISRTTWIPNAEWWPDRPGNYSAEDVQLIVDKALAGEKLGPKQQELIEYMTEVADQRVASEPYLPHPNELDSRGMEHTPDNAFESAMVARLAAIDEEAVESLARRFEDDDAAFMEHVKEYLDAHDTDARLARGGQEDQEPHGIAADRRTAGRPAGEAGAGGSQPSGAAAETEGSGAGNAGEPAGQPAAVGQPSPSVTDLLKSLPTDQRAPLEARIAALKAEPREPPPITAAPGDSTVGAAAGNSREAQLKDLSLARGGRVLGKALGWFAPGSRLLSSPSLAARQTVVKLIETPEMLEMNVPSPARPFGVPTPISVQALLRRWEGTWPQAFRARDQAYRDYRARPQLAAEGEKIGKHEFNERVSMALRRKDQSDIPEVTQAAQTTRRIVFDPLKVEAQKLGLLPPSEDLLHGTAESYLMRQYNRAAIQKDRTGWHQTLVQGFMDQGLDLASATDVAHKVTSNILGSELGLLDLDHSVFHAIPQSGRLMERTLKLPDLALEKYLVNDIDTLSHSYLKSLAPQVEMLKMFRDDLTNDGVQQSAQAARVLTGDPQAGPSVADRRNLTGPAKEITDEYAILKQRALAAGDSATANALDKRMRSDLRDIARIRDRLYGIDGAPSDSSSWIQRAGRVIRSVNVLRLLGSATFSHIPDLANVVMKRGLPQTMAAAAKLSSSLEALKLNKEQLQRIGTAADMIHNATAAALGEFGVESDYALQKALNRTTRAFTIATLETPWIATCKMLAGAAAHDEILAAANTADRFAKGVGPDLTPNERSRLNQIGIDQNMLQRIASQFGTYGQNVNGLRFGMTDKWHDVGAAQAVDAATASAGEASTLSPGAGDTPLWTSSEVGKAIFQFKTFGAVAIRRVTIPLAQGIAHSDLRSASGLATLIAAGALTYTIKQLISGQPIEKDPGRYALEVLDKSNLLGWTGEYFYPSLWQFGMGNFSRWGDRQTWETLGGPVAGTAVDAWDLRLPAKLIGTVRGQGPHISRSDIHRVRRMLPANQVWYLRRAVNAAEGHVGDSMGLPPAPVAGSSE